MNRRNFVRLGVSAWAGWSAGLARADATTDGEPTFWTEDARWQAAYDAAKSVLAGNVQRLPQYPGPVLIEGSVYHGIWMECGPMEGWIYRRFSPAAARNNHLAFFAQQRADGQFPAAIKRSETGFGQIQTVVSIAATAWELARSTGDEELLQAAYPACARWEDWLMRYRNTRGTGLVEGFCTYDTGTDNSPRWAGIPNRCPQKDAKQCPPLASLPRLCPDLSATSYGARRALGAMSRAIGRDAEARRWEERADEIRQLILARLYDPADGIFYDRDAQDQFVRIRTEAVTRVCGEHVPDQPLFDELWRRQLGRPSAFWAPFPFPSIALDDPHFVRPIPANSWGGASQALTALRAARWMDHYRRSAEFGVLMERWCEAIQRDPSFRQQMDPLSGAFTQAGAPNYSPCALVMVDFTWRLAGIVEEPGALHWNVRPGHPAARSARFGMKTDAGPEARLRYDPAGAELSLGGRSVARVANGSARVTTDRTGAVLALTGIAEHPQRLTLARPGRPERTVAVRPNELIPAAAFD